MAPNCVLQRTGEDVFRFNPPSAARPPLNTALGCWERTLTGRDFAMAAHPHSWMQVADNLYDQSIAIYSRFPTGKTTQTDGNGKIVGEWASANRSTFLLAGFALENAVKAFLVYENPQWVSNGVLARPLRSHRLVALAQRSSIIPWQKRGLSILSRFEQGLESWARYPCALTAVDSEAEKNLSPALWANYLGLMRAYGKSLMALLQQGWDGPHGVGGHFKLEGSFLGAQPNYSFKPTRSARLNSRR